MEKLAHRLKEFIEASGHTIYSFEMKAGLKKNALWKSINDGSSFGADKLISVGRNFPQLNFNWLINGEGEMFKESPAAEVVIPVTPTFTPIQATLDKDVEHYKQKVEEYRTKYEAVLEEYTRCLKEKDAQKTVAVGRATH